MKKKSIGPVVSYSFGWARWPDCFTPANMNLTLHDRRDELDWSTGWCVRGKLSARRVLSLSLRAFCQSGAKKNCSLSPTTHEGEGRKQPSSGWCMVWTPVWDLGFNQEKGRKWKGGGGSCLNYADAGRNSGGKPTKGMAASTGTCSHK